MLGSRINFNDSWHAALQVTLPSFILRQCVGTSCHLILHGPSSSEAKYFLTYSLVISPNMLHFTLIKFILVLKQQLEKQRPPEYQEKIIHYHFVTRTDNNCELFYVHLLQSCSANIHQF